MRITPIVICLLAVVGASEPQAWCSPIPRPRVAPSRPGALPKLSHEFRYEISRLNLERNSAELRLIAPRRAQLGIPFDVNLWLTRSSPLSAISDGAVTTAFATPSGAVSYEPQQIDLRPDRPQRIKAVVDKSESGLALLEVVTSDGKTTTAGVDVGFKGLIRARLGEVLESNTTHVITLEFVDQAGRSLAIEAPVVAMVRATKAMLRLAPTDTWSENLTLSVPTGSRSLPTFELRPRSWVAAEGVLRAQIALTEDYVLADASFPFGIVPWGWAQLACSIGGGLVYGVYVLLRRRSTRQFRRSITVIFSSALSGLLVYLLATWNIIGIKVDTSSLRAFVLLGFLFAYLGVDAVIRALAAKSDLRIAPAEGADDGKA